MQTYQIFSSQNNPHRNLIDLVRRFKDTAFRRPIPPIQQRAFDDVAKIYAERKRPLIIDAGCGTGMSTAILAQQFPDHDVIGIDKSLHRLARTDRSRQQDNAWLVRADLVDMWRLLKDAALPITHHFMFYPNPWPKIGHVKRRFYAHPVFATMLSIAPYLEVRTNWQVYADEMTLALETLGQKPAMTIKDDDSVMTLFEKKYLEAGCTIYVVKNNFIPW